MGTITTNNIGLVQNEKCHICGNETLSGYWLGSNGVFCVCQECAVKVLPTLIVDSLYYFYLKDLSWLDNKLSEVKEVFWKAAFTRLMVHTSKKKSEDD